MKVSEEELMLSKQMLQLSPKTAKFQESYNKYNFKGKKNL